MIEEKIPLIAKQKITDLLAENETDAALQYCKDLLTNNSASAEIYNILGIISAQVNDLQNSIAYLKQAISLNPNEAIFYNNLSNAYKKQGDLKSAIAHLHKALALSPNYAEGYNNLGSLYYTQGRLQEADPFFEKAIRLDPNYWEPHYNFANSLIKQDKVSRAIEHYQTVLALQPNHQAAIQNLAMTYIADKQLLAALPLLEQAIKNNPQHPELHAQLAECYIENGNTSKAIDMFNIALHLSPQNSGWQHNLAILYLRDQQQEKALLHFQAALACDPTNQTALHMVSALTNSTITNAPTQYVSALFNQYAQFYNQHVTKQLHYKVPELLRQSISKNLTYTEKALHILELGCGTGLCSIYFRDLARYLVGIDLSPAMLAQAKSLNAYDALCCGNILQSIPGENSNFFDLIIAADVLVYCGDLENLFALSNKALKDLGMFAFTIEKLTTGSYKLQNSGRFAHTHNYIVEISAKYNFSIVDTQEVTLRMQHNIPTIGLLYVLHKFK